MQLVTLDFETYYDAGYSLSKMTTEEYIRDVRFETIGVSAKRGDGPTTWFSGTDREIEDWLWDYCDWSITACVSHNMMFDGAILGWRYGIHPKALMCTLSMSRGHIGPYQRHALAALADRYKLKAKGTAVHNAKGKRRLDFTRSEMAEYADYCMHDTNLCYQLLNIMLGEGFPPAEMKLIDMTLRMFTQPTLELDEDILQGHLMAVKRRKQQLVTAASADPATLRSAAKFAELLQSIGVTPPTKISPKTGKETYAFAKTDEAMRELAQHPDERVQALIAAKLGVSSTLAETRTQRFIDIARRGTLPIPLKYYAAHTGRWGGDDKLNLQNLPSRGGNTALKDSIVAPAGYVLINSDSSQIEARILAWLAGQNDLLQGFVRGEDVYKDMASSIYRIPVEEVDKAQRGIGKATILGCGYNMGGERFQGSLAENGIEMDLDEAFRVVSVYRSRNADIVDLWKDAQHTIKEMVQGRSVDFGRPGVLAVDHTLPGLWLPNGMPMIFDRLEAVPEDERDEDRFGDEFRYFQRQEPVNFYGGKLVENVCQALARIIVGYQMLLIRKRYPVVITVHDSAVVLAPEEEADEAQAYVEHCMKQTPKWADGLPITCESGVARSYGKA